MSIAGWFIVTLALFLANLPFAANRFLSVIPLRQGKKPWFYLAEFAVAYVALTAIAYTLERQEGTVFSQGWQFYAITMLLLIVFSFPGFVYRFLLRQR
ncbi:uncharacterized protein DUF2818 [Paraburkholderia sp. BL8N3]|nr:DUF2818 family protein [Paraburkholderia sp. BL8N3]TCK33511.1 uncharacterized protein DUF2818 [Paraburkholderia sp. BL8N3]